MSRSIQRIDVTKFRPMTDTPRRRLSDSASSTPTFVGVGTELVGNLRCRGDLVVGGTAQADCTVEGSFTLSEGGVWQGRLESRNAVIAGDVIGDIVVAEKLEIRKSARIRGSVTARSIAVARGALIDGAMSVTSGAPVVSFEEKRAND
jgi:cytoskeletal protein CcmA (bactofilin family)